MCLYVDVVMSIGKVRDARHTPEGRGMYESKGLLQIGGLVVPLCECDGKKCSVCRHR